LYLILVALAAYGLGGYLAGRLRSHLSLQNAEEVEFRDGCHGLAVWAIATILTALFVMIGVAATSRLAAPSGGPAGPATSVAGENLIAFDLDKLFRADRRPDSGDFAYSRAEAARILLTVSGHSGIAPDDRTYLVRLVSNRTGLSQADSERRVDTVIASARDNVARARRSTVILAFMAAAAALLGAAAAWFAACAGGHHREQAPTVRWGLVGPRVVPHGARGRVTEQS